MPDAPCAACLHDRTVRAAWTSSGGPFPPRTCTADHRPACTHTTVIGRCGKAVDGRGPFCDACVEADRLAKYRDLEARRAAMGLLPR